MPSPFPGMDPYLENTSLWPGVHQNIITYANDALNRELPQGFVASIGERMVVIETNKGIYPDLAVRSTQVIETPAREARFGASTLTIARPFVLALETEEVRETYIEILDVRQGERVITAVEVLSYTNKSSVSDARRKYLAKQTELMNSSTHLLEIDLLRGGTPTLMPPPDQLSIYKDQWLYATCLHRAGSGRTFEVWLSALSERLPCIPIPLTEGLQDVPLDLQAVLDRAYDSGAYIRRIDYRREPAPPLSAADAAWADTILREKGLRA